MMSHQMKEIKPKRYVLALTQHRTPNSYIFEMQFGSKIEFPRIVVIVCVL